MYPTGQGAKKTANNKKARNLADFVEAQKLKETAPWKDLASLGTDGKHIALAFDGTKILEDARKAVQEEDQIAIYTNSISSSVYLALYKITGIVDELYTYCASQSIKFSPMIIFDGLGFTPLQDDLQAPPLQIPPEVASRNVLNDQEIPADFKNKCSERFTIDEDLEGFIVQHLCLPQSFQNGPATTIRAPYLARSQISAFFHPSSKKISEAYSSLELLAFPGVDRVILDIDEKSKTFTFVSKQKLLNAAKSLNSNLSDEKICAALLLQYNPKKFEFQTPLLFEDICIEISSHPDAYAYINSSSAFPPSKRKYLNRNLAALDAPVMTTSNTVVPLGQVYTETPRISSGAVANYFGRTLPMIFYYALMTGPLLPAPFAALSQDILLDDWPLVDSNHYRAIAERILALRVQIIHQLLQYIKGNVPKFQPHTLTWLRQYFMKKNSQFESRSSNISNPPEVNLISWDVPPSNPQDPPQEIYFSDALTFAENSSLQRRIFNDNQAISFVILLRSLDLLGYFTHYYVEREQSVPSLFGEALVYFSSCPSLSEYGVLLIELFRTGALTDEPLLMVARDPQHQRHYGKGVLFAARAVSIVHLNVMGVWTGPFDTEMAAFGTCTRLFGKSLRSLTEALATNVFASKEAGVSLSEFRNVVSSLPFKYPIEFNAGFLMLYVLSFRGQITIDILQKKFPELVQLESDLYILFMFWSMTYSALRTLFRTEPNPVAAESVQLAHNLMLTKFGVLFPGDPLLVDVIEAQNANDYRMYAQNGMNGMGYYQ